MTTIKLRRGTAAQWTTINPILAQGEPGFETDTGKHKIGNGITAWASLKYYVDEIDLSNAVAGEVSARDAAINTAVSNLINGAPTSLDTLLEISSQLASDESAAAAILSAFNSHTSNTSNPHSVTKAQVGLGSVPNIDTTAAIGVETSRASDAEATKVPKWQPSTAYTAGDVVMAPDGSIVKRLTSGTSGSSYTSDNWKSTGNPTFVVAAATGTDWAKINTALQAAKTAGNGMVVLQPGQTYVVNAEVPLPNKVVLNLNGSTIQLAASTNTRVIVTENFDTLTGTNAWFVSEGVPTGFGIINGYIDGNKANNPIGGHGVALYGKRYLIDNLIIHDCHGDGFYSECAQKIGQTETDDLPESEINQLYCRSNDGNGVTYHGPHDGHIGSVYTVLSGGDGFISNTITSVYGGTCDVDFIHSYGNVGNGVWLGAAASFGNLISESNGLQGLVLANAITRVRIGTGYVYNNCLTSTTNPHVELLSCSNAVIGALTIRGDNGGVGFRNASGAFYTNVGSLNIDGRSTAGVGIDIVGNNISFATATVLNYSAAGGIGVRVASGVSNVELNCTTLNNATHLSYLGSPSRSRFNFNGFVAAGQVDVTGTLPSATSLCQYRHAFGGPGASLVNSNNMLAGSSWNAGHALLGGNHLWVDASGSLRIKSSAPASDSDGNSVFSSTVLTAEYTTAQTNTSYSIPVGATTLVIEAQAGGSGAGSGRRGAAGTVRCGGGGAAAGTRTIIEVAVADLSVSSLFVTVGDKGLGGAAQTVDDTDGNPGTIGGTSAVRTTGSNTAASTLATTNPGAIGSGGTAATGAGGASSNIGTFAVVSGSSASVTGGVGGAAGASAGAAGSGGSGGGLATGNANVAGGAGGVAGGGYSTAATAGTSGGGNGANGSDNAVLSPGQGGAGGGSNNAGVAGSGGNGGRGGGGGGGGASANGNASGKGGDGGVGYVKITALF